MTDKLTKEKLESTFEDVRKAYRLLYIYQNRVLDIIKHIGSLISKEYYGGWSKFSKSSPNSGQGKLDSDAWDWLNMYSYDFYFEMDHKNKVEFSIWLVSDTGYYDNATLNNGNKKELGTFSSVEDAETRLIFIAGKNTWYVRSGFNDFEEKVLKKGSSSYVTKKINNESNETEIIVAKSYKLSSFINEEDTINQCKDFEKLCKENGISEIKVSLKN